MPNLYDIDLSGPDLSGLDLSDPSPPVPGAAARAAVATRARQLTRRHRLAQAGGAAAAVAIIAVAASVVALSAGGGSDRGVHVANAPATGVAPEVAMVSGTIPIAPGAHLHLELTGPGGTYAVDTAADGSFRFDGITPGTYHVVATQETPSADPNLGSAIQVAKATATLVAGDNSLPYTIHF